MYKKYLFIFFLSLCVFTHSYKLEFKKSFSDVSGINTGVVNTYKLNVRSGPSTLYPKIDTLYIGEEITLNRSASESWLEITMEPIQGYVYKDFIDLENFDTDEVMVFDFDTSEVFTDYNTVDTTEIYGIVNGNSVNVRKDPDEKGKRLAIVNKRVRLKILGKKDDWYNISFLSKRTGYVYARYISKTRKAKIKMDFTPVFKKPEKGAVLKYINSDVEAFIFEKKGDFFRVFLKGNNLTGWVPKESVVEY